MSICPTCEEEFEAKRAMKIHHSKKHGESIGRQELECEFCSQTFERYDSQAERATYCSKDCLYEDNQRQTGKNHPKWKRNEKTCEQCGEKYFPAPHRHEESRFCSIQCIGDWCSDHLSGENSPHWKGGVCEDYGKKWSAISRSIIERDQKCRICGSKDNLHAHHIVPRREFEDVNNANEEHNLVTLCATCHPRVEKGILPNPEPLKH